MASLHDGGGNVSHVPAPGDVVAVLAECAGGVRSALGASVFYDADAVYVDFLGTALRGAFGPADGRPLFTGDFGSLGGGVFMAGLCLVGMGLARGLVPFLSKL